MTNEKFIMVSMDDPISKKLAEVLGNDSCKKIINYLAEKNEASAKDISDALNMPLNTVDYNLKKLLESGFVEKKKNFFWSKKGKKIIMYGLSNKSLIISPKKSKLTSKMKSIIPVVLIAGLGTILVNFFTKSRNILEKGISEEASVLSSVQDSGVIQASNSILNPSNTILQFPYPAWVWFLAGAIVVLFIFSIVNWRKLWKEV